MRRTIVLLALTATLLAVAAAPATASGLNSRLGLWSRPGVVATFPPGDNGAFCESLAADRTGHLFASVTVWGTTANTGQIWRIAANGRKTLVATADLGATGMLSGLAFDARGRLFVGWVDFADPSVATPGVARLAGETLTRVVTLPGTSFPNGLAFHDGRLYVSDSAIGAIWRLHPGHAQAPARPWLQNDLLLPGANGLGANGIAFRHDRLTVAVSDAGRVVQVRVRANGSAGAPVVVAEKPELASVDGIAYDVRGGLWLVTNANGLMRLGPKGGLSHVASDPGWLDYPTQPVFGTTPATRTLLYIANGSFDNGTPNVLVLNAGVRGLRLP
ncbi:MAG: SMP-30/gluconolactonase/LRE family protein [Thermoleophilia bacterium]